MLFKYPKECTKESNMETTSNAMLSKNMASKKQIYKPETLEKIVKEENSCVSLVQTERQLALLPIYQNDIKSGVSDLLNKSLKKFDRNLNGILMGYKNVKILLDNRNTGKIIGKYGAFQVNVKLEYYIFQPKIGSYLEGVVNKKSNTHIGCLVHHYFNATILKPDHIEYEDWSCRRINVGDRIVFKVVELDFSGYLPHIEGFVEDDFIVTKRNEENGGNLSRSISGDSGSGLEDVELELIDANSKNNNVVKSPKKGRDLCNSTQRPSLIENDLKDEDFNFLSPVVPGSSDKKKNKDKDIVDIDGDVMITSTQVPSGKESSMVEFNSLSPINTVDGLTKLKKKKKKKDKTKEKDEDSEIKQVEFSSLIGHKKELSFNEKEEGKKEKKKKKKEKDKDKHKDKDKDRDKKEVGNVDKQLSLELQKFKAELDLAKKQNNRTKEDEIERKGKKKKKDKDKDKEKKEDNSVNLEEKLKKATTSLEEKEAKSSTLGKEVKDGEEKQEDFLSIEKQRNDDRRKTEDAKPDKESKDKKKKKKDKKLEKGTKDKEEKLEKEKNRSEKEDQIRLKLEKEMKDREEQLRLKMEKEIEEQLRIKLEQEMKSKEEQLRLKLKKEIEERLRLELGKGKEKADRSSSGKDEQDKKKIEKEKNKDKKLEKEMNAMMKKKDNETKEKKKEDKNSKKEDKEKKKKDKKSKHKEKVEEKEIMVIEKMEKGLTLERETGNKDKLAVEKEVKKSKKKRKHDLVTPETSKASPSKVEEIDPIEKLMEEEMKKYKRKISPDSDSDDDEEDVIIPPSQHPSASIHTDVDIRPTPNSNSSTIQDILYLSGLHKPKASPKKEKSDPFKNKLDLVNNPGFKLKRARTDSSSEPPTPTKKFKTDSGDPFKRKLENHKRSKKESSPDMFSDSDFKRSPVKITSNAKLMEDLIKENLNLIEEKSTKSSDKILGNSEKSNKKKNKLDKSDDKSRKKHKSDQQSEKLVNGITDERLQGLKRQSTHLETSSEKEKKKKEKRKSDKGERSERMSSADSGFNSLTSKSTASQQESINRLLLFAKSQIDFDSSKTKKKKN